ncbi:uncharacterized protein LOC113340951 [Papaver somniferum]|uniref:uncharacterized protein LOC113340951 n=1 Tax=Papaver somniferum TaxID=3469 RepID=UPI000E6F8D2C|nr:uncharacterized protein LOC113340951 [Papaver somniferum]
MENLRAKMMTEIKQLKTRKGGERLEQVMKEASTTPLTQRFAKSLIPQKCPVPAFECYDGSSDPVTHLLYYNRMMARWDYDDAILCRYFPSSLKGSPLSWFDNLPPSFIDSYDQLTEKFLTTYIWHKISQAIGNVDPVVSINCYKWGMDRMSPLFIGIHDTIPATEGDLRVIIEKHERLEEIQRENPKAHTQRPSRTNFVKQASGSKRGNSDEQPGKDRRERRDDPRRGDRKFEDQVYTKLNTSYSCILKEIKGRENLDWPWSKGKQPPRSKKSREYCEYHCFNVHQTDKCKNLKIMIQKLNDAGVLKQYVHRTSTEDKAKRSK